MCVWCRGNNNFTVIINITTKRVEKQQFHSGRRGKTAPAEIITIEVNATCMLKGGGTLLIIISIITRINYHASISLRMLGIICGFGSS